MIGVLAIQVGTSLYNGSSGSPSWTVAAAGGSQDVVLLNGNQYGASTPASGGTGNVWQTFPRTFLGSGTSTTLTVTGTAAARGQYIGLDNGSRAAAPEPSQVSALGPRGRTGYLH